jgi:hypothetical protein
MSFAIQERDSKEFCFAGCQWLTPVILATQEEENRRIPYLKKAHHIKGLVEWLTMKALS